VTVRPVPAIDAVLPVVPFRSSWRRSSPFVAVDPAPTLLVSVLLPDVL
jgi:hypothetical protein